MSVLGSIPARIGFTALLATTLSLITLIKAADAIEPIQGSGGPSASYDFAGEDCTGGGSDPVGVVFRGKHASAINVSHSIDVETLRYYRYEGGHGTETQPWIHHENGHRQSLSVHEPDDSYGCENNNASNAEAREAGPYSRYHIRLWFVPGSAGGSEIKTVGTPHHELYRNPLEWPNCGGSTGLGNHAIDYGGVNWPAHESGFDRARRALRNVYESGPNPHKVDPESWGNSQEFKQCDSNMAGSNGTGIIIWGINYSIYPQTLSASSINQKSATLNGNLFTEEPKTEYWFAYGPNPSQGVSGYPSKTAVKSVSGTAEFPVSEAISGLSANTMYYVRMFARNQDGEVAEGDQIQYSTCSSGNDIQIDQNDSLSGPRAVAQCNGTVDVFYRQASSGNLGHQWWTPANGWETETRDASIAPGAVPRAVAQPNGNGTVDVFYRDVNGNLGHQWWTPANGWATETRSASMASDPVVTAQPDDTVDVFYRDVNGNLGHQWWTPANGWATETRSASIAPGAKPKVIVQSNGIVGIFYRDVNGDLGHQWWTPSNGWATETRDASMASDPVVTAQPDGTVNIFFRDVNGDLGHHWWTPTNGWATETRDTSMAPGATPHVIAQSNGIVGIFFRDVNGDLGHHWWTPTNGWATETRDTSMTFDPVVTAQPDGTVNIFFRDVNGDLGHHWWTPTNGWATETRDTSMTFAPQVVAQPGGIVDVFYRDINGNLGHQWWSPTNGWASETREATIAVPPPIATSNPATNVTENGATLNGTVGSEGAATTYSFEYGKTTSYGSSAPVPDASAGSGLDSVGVSQQIAELQPEHTYHYRLKATSSEGTAFSADRTFTTKATPATYESSFASKGAGNGQLQRPLGITRDSAGDFWVADADNNRVEKFNAKGEYLFQFGTKGSGNGQLIEPRDIAFTPQGNLWVSDAGNGRIQEFTPQGTYIQQAGIAEGSKGKDNLVQPYGILVDLQGRIWVCDSGGNEVVQFSEAASNGDHYVDSYGEAPALSYPAEIAADSQGTLWITASASNRVFKLQGDSHGNYKLNSAFGKSGSEPGQLSEPRGIVVKPSGNLEIVEKGNNRVQTFSPSGEYLDGFGVKGSGAGQMLEPRGLAKGPGGTIYVTDGGNNRIEIWSQSWGSEATTDAATEAFATRATLNGKVNPEGLATAYWFEYGETTSYGTKIPASPKSAGSGTEYVAVSQIPTGLKEATTYHFRVVAESEAGIGKGKDRTFTTLKAVDALTEGATAIKLTQATLNGKVNPEGNSTTYWFEYGTSKSYGTKIPVSPVSAGSGAAYVTVSQTPTGLKASTEYHFRVVATNAEGTSYSEDKTFKTGIAFLLAFGKKGEGKGEFKHPADIAIDAGGNAWVVDMENNRLEKFDKEGKYLTGFGEAGKGKCQLERPKSVAIDSKGNLWVDDAGNFRIQKFNEAGECLLAFGEMGTKEGQFFDAESIAIDSKDDIWVADTYNHRLQEFSSEGKLIRVVQPAEGKSGHMSNPSGIDIGPGGNVWVSDWWASAIFEFNSEGTFVQKFSTTGLFNGKLTHPDTIEVVEEGTVWVTDELNGRIQWFSEKGVYEGEFGSLGSGEGQFKFEFPAGITSDAEGNLWIADSLNGRAQKWAR